MTCRYGIFNYLCSRNTGVAQLVEHRSPKPGVGSSSLSSRAVDIRLSSPHNKFTIINFIRSMKNIRLFLVALCTLPLFTAQADEGMWLLQLMQEQHLADMMKKQGLQMEVDDIYNPNKVSLKDAVGIFGGGCTGEIISPEGLILTNHHCGYDAIQQHSSVEHDYLTDGFWAMNRKEEIPTPGLQFTFIEKIEDVTDIINKKIADKEATEAESFTYKFLSTIADSLLSARGYADKFGYTSELLPFYAGNRYYFFVKKVYSDVRMVAAPPSSVGKFGGETDNWMWPRHTGDFSMFRIYANENGEPADYNESNVPLKTKKHFAISLRGIEDGDYTMIMGFPGSTERYLTASGIQQMMDCSNTPRIRIRTARQEVLKSEMDKSDKVRIQYASKYARSSNYWKNAIGMNKAIVDNKVLEGKKEQETRFAEFAKRVNNKEYQEVVSNIDQAIQAGNNLEYQWTCLIEAISSGIEYGTPYMVMEQLKQALDEKNDSLLNASIQTLKESYANIHDKDYDHEVDRKVAKVILPLYAEMVPASERPAFYQTIEKEFKGDYNKYVDALYDNTIFANDKNFNKFIKKPNKKAIDKDLMRQFAAAKWEKLYELQGKMKDSRMQLLSLYKIYVRGLGEMNAPTPQYPDANFTIRLTYGNVKSYDPKDAVHYDYYTTTDGILEKEDPNNREFNVPAKLKELILKKDFGRYTMKNGEMPVCFTSTNDITGGNSGSPVINARGELIGAAFDGNWESLSGDINFDNEKQRCINVDIRYVLFIIEKLGGAKHLIDEMTIVE